MKERNVSRPQFPHLLNGSSNIYLAELWSGVGGYAHDKLSNTFLVPNSVLTFTKIACGIYAHQEPKKKALLLFLYCRH